ncbi:CubicO group peptidase, beta-lactamase class C family [Nonomuraea solani]|uniref:CubicO group peptidase, beta-lactamase class C family n=1 Tax=Nonomuraea solani TaxID=1144553 RepID=A0A1H6AXQ4_9ACTN|nr:serine hydrolase domain-containing protein [Nonomuraea solani]SEG53331.1 CubicO group peptidase, beta-lactamase class C family [Nonomuraea solani]
MTVHGTCDPRFSQVAEEFEANLTLRGEVGASVCVMVGGEVLVDLWGGEAAPGVPWASDTIGHVWSCTKGATALCAHLLAVRGDLDLDAPVIRYWPEYGTRGKGATLVRHLLTHQAGLPTLREPPPPGAFYDWKLMADRLANEEPFWEPGTRHGYHALTFGYLIGEVVRRVSGRSLGTFFREEVAEPLGLEFWMGLPKNQEGRVAPTIPADPPEEPPAFYVKAFTDPASLPALVLAHEGGYMALGESDSRAAHSAEIGAVGAITNARGLAGLYRPLSLGGGDLVTREHLAYMAVTASAGIDAVLLAPTRFSLGFMKATDNRHLPPADSEGALLSATAFGHAGMGGSVGFCDPAARLAFGYTMNKQGAGLGVNPRGQALVDATYRALGYQQVYGGMWYAPGD